MANTMNDPAVLCKDRVRRATALLALLCGAAILLAPVPALSAESIGTVIGVQGTVTAMNDSGSRVLEMTSLVHVEDTILTGPDSKVQILFNDDTILAQGPMSESTLADYAYLEGGDEDSRFLLDMTEGTFRVITGKIVEDNPDEGFRMQTPLAVIGIRGTMTGHQVHPGEEHHYSLDLEGSHTVDITTRFDQGLVSLTDDFQALDILPGMSSDGSRDMTPEEQEFMTTSTSITQYNPRPGTVLAGTDTDGTGADGTGDPILDGDGSLVEGDGTTLDADGTIYDLGLDDGSGTEEMVNVVASGQEVTGTVLATGPTFTTMHALEGYFLKNGIATIPPYLLPMTGKTDVFEVYGEGPTDTLELDTTLNKITSLGIDGRPAASVTNLPLHLSYNVLGQNTDSQWGYWAQSSGLDPEVSPDVYELVRLYEVTVDVPTVVRTDLAGIYNGTASGIMNIAGSQYTSSTGFFSANVTDVTSGTINFSISVTFGPGVYNASGIGSINNGTFDLLVTGAALDIPGAASAGSSDIFGGVGKDGSMAGTWHFWSDPDSTVGSGEFHGTHN